MNRPYPEPFSYEDAVKHCASAVSDYGDSLAAAAANAGMAFALSLAYNVKVVQVHADIRKHFTGG